MEKLYPVVHQNFITESNGLVYCKKKHKVVKLSIITPQCFECPYFYGCLQGEGVECGWEDVIADPFVAVINPQEEFLRVSQLIDKKIIRKD